MEDNYRKYLEEQKKLGLSVKRPWKDKDRAVVYDEVFAKEPEPKKEKSKKSK